MKQLFTYSILVFALILGSCGNNKNISKTEENSTSEKKTIQKEELVIDNSKIEWYSMEEGIQLARKYDKLIFVDVYTDWCGWCKRMDATTFVDANVITAMNEKYIAIKFDAEQKDSLEFFGTTYSFKENGRRGYHELAAVLLDGRLSYPSFVVLNKNGNRVKKLIGYQKSQQLITQLKTMQQ